MSLKPPSLILQKRVGPARQEKTRGPSGHPGVFPCTYEFLTPIAHLNQATAHAGGRSGISASGTRRSSQTVSVAA